MIIKIELLYIIPILRLWFDLFQHQVDEEGIPLSLCLSKFKKWIKDLSVNKSLTFTPPPSAHETSLNYCAFVTWSGEFIIFGHPIF